MDLDRYDHFTRHVPRRITRRSAIGSGVAALPAAVVRAAMAQEDVI